MAALFLVELVLFVLVERAFDFFPQAVQLALVRFASGAYGTAPTPPSCGLRVHVHLIPPKVTIAEYNPESGLIRHITANG